VAGWRYRHLILRLAVRRIQAQYRGSLLGMLWAALVPLLMLAVYTFTFSFVLKARWSPQDAGETDFALIVFSGMILFGLFQRIANEAPTLMVANQTYIKQIVFPSEVLPWVSLLASLFDFAVSFALWVGFYVLARGTPLASWLFLPLLLLPILLFALGIAWLLSSLGVFLRDLPQIVGVATTMLLFLSPIFYPVTRIPDWAAPYYHLNPFVGILEASRGSLFFGTPPNWRSWALVTAAGWGIAWIGYAWFMRTKPGFADVL